MTTRPRPRPTGRPAQAALGRRGEDHAAAAYEKAGAHVLGRNVREGRDEIDLIVEEPDGTVVFVEVKTRRGHGFGAAEAVTAAKLHRMRRTAAAWLGDKHWAEVRLDVVEVVVAGDGTAALTFFKGVDEGA